jgi:RNA polymerase sigma factor (sigma-70 family)
VTRAEWDAIIRTHGRRVLAHLVARGVRIDLAKELVQEAWAKLIEQEGAGQLRDLQMPGLILRQATFLALDAARRQRWSSGGELPERADSAPAIDEVLASRSQLARARDAFARAPAAEQRIFLALYEQPQLTCAQVATELGLSQQRVKQVAYEVRKRLRAALEEES